MNQVFLKLVFKSKNDIMVFFLEATRGACKESGILYYLYLLSCDLIFLFKFYLQVSTPKKNWELNDLSIGSSSNMFMKFHLSAYHPDSLLYLTKYDSIVSADPTILFSCRH